MAAIASLVAFCRVSCDQAGNVYEVLQARRALHPDCGCFFHRFFTGSLLLAVHSANGPHSGFFVASNFHLSRFSRGLLFLGPFFSR